MSDNVRKNTNKNGFNWSVHAFILKCKRARYAYIYIYICYGFYLLLFGLPLIRLYVRVRILGVIKYNYIVAYISRSLLTFLALCLSLLSFAPSLSRSRSSIQSSVLATYNECHSLLFVIYFGHGHRRMGTFTHDDAQQLYIVRQ